VLDETMRRAPRSSVVTVVGACMEPDTIHPMYGINKELRLHFVLGYTPEEFAGTLRSLADGAIDVAPLHTGTVDLDGVADAFRQLADPERHAKILVVPR
jgi:threonine dehydrogenase-like Zn-dependent dehydrogenase